MRDEIVPILIVFLVVCGLGMFLGWLTAPSKLEIRIAEYICEEHDGLYELNRIALENKVVVCNDGSTHSPHGVIIKK